MPTDAYEQAQAWATDWSQRWFLDPTGNDRLRVAGIDAGWASHVDAYEVLHRFAMVRLGEHVGRPRSFTGRAKSRGWDRAIRAVSLRLLQSPESARVVSRPIGDLEPIALVVEIPTPSMVQGLAQVAAHLGERGVLTTTDPRAFRALRQLGLEPRALHAIRHRSSLPTARREIEAGWAAIRRDAAPMELDGHDVGRDALAALEPLVRRSLPWVAAEALASRQLLQRLRPRSLGLASDQHRMGRILTQVAAETATPTVVLQHGLPQARVGYLPVVARTVATWSEASSAWFVDAGTSPDRLRVTGNPRFDEYADRDGDRSKPDGSPRLLLALSPTARRINELLLQSTLGAVESLPTARLVIKLHPGQGSWEFVSAAVARSTAAPRIEVRRHAPLGPLLRWAEVTMVHRSTVVVDSLAAGTPVILARAGDASPAEERELAGLNLPVADGAEGLAREITALHGRAGMYFREREAAIERVTGPVDGQSAARIADVLATTG
jgi:hypothetical protein